MRVLVSLLVLLMCGATPMWPQSKEPPSKNSAELSIAWEKLSTQFEGTLDELELSLKRLLEKQAILESNGELLTFLCKELSRQNSGLKNYNGQIAQRMQERDEDLAEAYAEAERLNNKIHNLMVWVVLLAVTAIFFLAGLIMGMR
jgi:hypothetical protein